MIISKQKSLIHKRIASVGFGLTDWKKLIPEKAIAAKWYMKQES